MTVNRIDMSWVPAFAGMTMLRIDAHIELLGVPMRPARKT